MNRQVLRAAIAVTAVLTWAAIAKPDGAEAAPPGAVYRSQQGTGVARAFCPTGMPVIGGGAFVEQPRRGPFMEMSLRQSYPISDATGTIAFGNVAVGWQAASSDFTGTVVAFVVCAGPALANGIIVEYVAAQSAPGAQAVARAFCPAGSKVTGGGSFVENLESGGLSEEKLRETHPISDPDGTIAFGTSAIGWQGSSSDFKDTVVTLAICTTMLVAIEVEYVSAFDTGLARAFCPAGATLTGGGVLVSNLESGGLSEEALRQTYPISDPSGTAARGVSAIGWQGASSDFDNEVRTFAICASD